MKSFFQFKSVLLMLFITASSCTPFRMVGTVNMISNRNIDTKLEYKQLTTYSGGSKAEIRKSRAKTIEEAIDNVVKKVLGGEFLMNVKIYLIDDKYFAAEGDVWGKVVNESEPTIIRGFKVGDKVTWKRYGKFRTGKITALKNNSSCLVQTDTDDKIIEMEYDEITKVR